jgi:hypothetical protein
MPPAIKISTGDCFGKLTIIKECSRRNNLRYVLCKCDCGKEKEILLASLRRGDVNTCGCSIVAHAKKMNFKNGLYKTRLHSIWENMKQRCYNPKASRYKGYGGRGITICKEWLDDFKNFYDWAMSNGYADNLTIDREKVNGNYEPDNCRWADNVKQNNNRTNNRLIIYNGVTKTLTEWAIELGFEHKTLAKRLDSGWPIEKAFTTTLMHTRKK